jgi:hypothetical protein
MSYRIDYSYSSGDSLGSEDHEDTLELTWESQEVARQNLRRIEEHWKYCQAFLEQRGHVRSDRKHDLAKELRAFARRDWYVPLGHPSDNPSCLILKTDDGIDWKFSCPWVGYFESFYGARVVENTNQDKFVTREGKLKGW